MLNIVKFVFNNFGENTFLVIDSATRQAAVIDPGMLHGEEREAFDRYIKDNGLKLTQIILTHAHLDHVFGAGYVTDAYGVPVAAHADDLPLALKAPSQTARFGMAGVIDRPLEFDVTLKDGDIIRIGESTLEVLHVPGHSPGGIVLYDRADGVAFVGDSIFDGSIGRTDLEGGDYATLISSIKNRILTLPDDTVLLPGHGNATTVKKEKESNPFL